MGIVDKFGVEGWTGVVVVLVVAFSLATTSVGRRLRCITPIIEKKERKMFYENRTARRVKLMSNWIEKVLKQKSAGKFII